MKTVFVTAARRSWRADKEAPRADSTHSLRLLDQSPPNARCEEISCVWLWKDDWWKNGLFAFLLFKKCLSHEHITWRMTNNCLVIYNPWNKVHKDLSFHCSKSYGKTSWFVLIFLLCLTPRRQKRKALPRRSRRQVLHLANSRRANKISCWGTKHINNVKEVLTDVEWMNDMF